MKILTQKDIDRFWGKVDKGHSATFYNGTRCWEWIEYCNPKGYGRMAIGRKHELAHRVAWTIANGEIPDNLFVLHHCDNPPCANPSHLFLGTNHDNVKDRELKGRGGALRGDAHYNHLHPETVRGENNPNAKITLKQVGEIRKKYAPYGVGGDSALTLAKEFGINFRTILAIVHNKIWKE